MSFTVEPRAGPVTGTEITNRATIVFDNNAPILTSRWINTIETPPVGVAEAPAKGSSGSFEVRCSSAD